MRLFFRCTITHDVTSTGSVSLLSQRDLDGEFTLLALNSDVRALHVAEQVIREVMEKQRSFSLEGIEVVSLPAGPLLVASIQSFRRPVASEIRQVEELIQERLRDNSVRLLVRTISPLTISSKGQLLYGKAHFEELPPEQKLLREKVEQAVKREVEKRPNLFATDVDAIKDSAGWSVRVKIVGPRIPSPTEVRTVERLVGAALKQPVRLQALADTEIVVTRDDYLAVDEHIARQAREEIQREKKRSSKP